jgi:hypothetical protein
MPVEGKRSLKVRLREQLQSQVDAHRANVQRRQLAVTFVWGGAMLLYFFWSSWELGYALPHRIAELEAVAAVRTSSSDAPISVSSGSSFVTDLVGHEVRR